MGPFYSNSSGDEDAEDASPAPGAASEPSDDDRDSSSIQSPGFEFPADGNPADDAASDAGSESGSAQSDGSDKSDWSDPSDSPTTGADSPTPPTITSAPRQRIPVKQLGQIPEVDNAQILAQAPDLATAWQQMAEQENARAQQISQINQSDPYISPEDGRWKKQSVDYPTGAIQETDILDSGTGKIDRSTGNIYVQTAQGPQVICVDPQQKRLAEIVSQKAQAQPFGQAQGPEPAEGVQGSPADAAIAAAKSALSDTQRQLQAYQGVPERMAAQIAKYTQATLAPTNTAAAAQLQNLQTAFANWKQQNPGYTSLISKRDALANQIQTQTTAKAQSDAQAAQLLTTPQYVQWSGNTPPALSSNPRGSQDAFAPSGSAPAADISIYDLDSRAGVIAAQSGYPAGLAYASALQEAKQQGAQTLDGSSIDDAIAAVQPGAEAQLPKMPGPQFRQAYQSGLITRQQLITAVQPGNAPANQAAVPADEEEEDDDETSPLTPDQDEDADPLAESIVELNSRAADLRNKIQTAFDTGGANGVKALATYRAALADTEDRLHASTQSLLNRMPADLQKRIANAVAPNLDWNDAAVKNAQDPMVNFATENIGSALRDQSMPPYLQIAIRKFTAARGINPDIADHIAHQALGAGAVSDLLRVLRGANIDQGRAQTLQDMGLLQPSDPADPASLPHLTEDALRLLPPGAQRFVQVRPDFAKYTPSPDPAHGSALYQNVVAGMQRFSDTAEKTLPPAPATPDSGAESADTQASSQPDSSNTASPAPDATSGLGNPSANPAASKDQSPDSTSTTPATKADGSAHPALGNPPASATAPGSPATAEPATGPAAGAQAQAQIPRDTGAIAQADGDAQNERNDAAIARQNAIEQRLAQIATFPELTSKLQEERADLAQEHDALDAYVNGDTSAYQKWADDRAAQQRLAQQQQQTEADNAGVWENTWNGIKSAGRVIAAGIGHGVKGILELDPAAPYSRMTETQRQAREADLDQQIAIAQAALAKDPKAVDPNGVPLGSGGGKFGDWWRKNMDGPVYFGDELRELQRQKMLVDRGREMAGTTADPEMWGRALAPEQLAESYGTNPALENTLAAKAGRVGGGVAGFALEGAVNPALPFAQMISAAASEGGDAAVQAAQERGETDADKLQAIRDHGAAVAGGYAAATAPLYLAGGKAAGTVAQRLLPGATALARAGLETGVHAASNVAVSALARKLQGGDLLPNGEQLGQDLGAAVLHGRQAWEATRKAQAIFNGTDEHAAMLGTVATDDTIPEATRSQAEQSLNGLRDQARQTLGVRSPAPPAQSLEPTQSVASPSSIPGAGPPPALNPKVSSEGALSADSGQIVAGGTNSAKAAPAPAGTPPEAQDSDGTSDAGKPNAPDVSDPAPTPDYQSAIEQIHHAEFRGSGRGKGVPMTLTITNDGRVILSKVGRVPSERARDEAETIFGKGNVEFVRGGVAKSGRHAEVRGGNYAGESASGAKQYSTHYACDDCASFQDDKGLQNMTGFARDHGGKISKPPKFIQP